MKVPNSIYAVLILLLIVLVWTLIAPIKLNQSKAVLLAIIGVLVGYIGAKLEGKGLYEP